MVQATKTNLDGLPILWRDTAPADEYEQARCRVFNTKVPDRFPTAIIRPRTVEHIRTGVKLAEELGCQVAIRSGGHSWACWSIRDRSVLIDLVDFTHTSYDADTDTLEASPSTTSLQGSKFLRQHGRYVPVGHCGDVGLGGFLLQGGMGLHCRGYGWACEYVKAIQVITADGELRHCDQEQNADLFWAARGAGPGFPAIITRFYLKTRPYLPAFKKQLSFWPISEYDTVMRWAVDMGRQVSDDVEVLAVSSEISQFQQHVFMFQATAFGHNDEDALEKLKIVKETRPPNLLHSIDDSDTSLEELYAYAEVMNPPDNRWIADDVYIHSSLDLVDVCRKSWTELPKDCLAFYEPLHPRTPRSLPDMALSLQTDHYIAIYSASQDLKQDASNSTWIAKQMLELEQSALGAFLGDADFQVRPTKFWSDEAASRLATVKQKWDPHGRICGYLTKGDKVQSLDNALHATGKAN